MSDTKGTGLDRRELIAAGLAGALAVPAVAGVSAAEAAPAPANAPAAPAQPQPFPPLTPDMTTSDILVETLIAWGVTHVFGIVGDGINPLMEAPRRRVACRRCRVQHGRRRQHPLRRAHDPDPKRPALERHRHTRQHGLGAALRRRGGVRIPGPPFDRDGGRQRAYTAATSRCCCSTMAPSAKRDSNSGGSAVRTTASSLAISTYPKVVEAVGGHGFRAATLSALEPAMKGWCATPSVALLDVQSISGEEAAMPELRA